MRGLIFTSCLLFCCTSVLSGQTQVSFATNHLIKEEVANILEKSKNTKSTATNKRIPFELDGGLIFVEARLGGITKSYVLDSGAPTLILNSKDFTSNATAIGISGETGVEARMVENFSLGEIKSTKIEAYVTDMSHLEKVKNRPIEGLIGMEHFGNEEILIDYEKQEIIALPKKRGNVFENFEMVQSFNFAMEKHMPIVRLKIGKRTYYFGIDSGAEVNLISKKIAKKLKKGNVQRRERKKMLGIDKNVAIVESARIKKVSLKKETFQNMEFVFANMEHFNKGYGVKLDGILGYPFLSKAIFSINYRKQKLCIWEKSIREEIDFPDTEVVNSFAKTEE